MESQKESLTLSLLKKVQQRKQFLRWISMFCKDLQFLFLYQLLRHVSTIEMIIRHQVLVGENVSFQEGELFDLNFNKNFL